jgi:hypothetical protein
LQLIRDIVSWQLECATATKQETNLMKRVIKLTAIIALPALCTFYAPAYAIDKIQTMSGGQVLSGGVGENARRELAQQAHGHELKLVFASTPSGSYLAEVPVTILDQSGRKIVDQVSQGPWMFVDIPSGKYTVKAVVGDQTRSRVVSVHEGSQKTVHFRWPEKLDTVTVHTGQR